MTTTYSVNFKVYDDINNLLLYDGVIKAENKTILVTKMANFYKSLKEGNVIFFSGAESTEIHYDLFEFGLMKNVNGYLIPASV